MPRNSGATLTCAAPSQHTGTMRRAVALLVVFMLVLCACHRRQARLVFTRREGARDVLYIVDPTGARAPVRALEGLAGDVYSGVSIDGGRGLLVTLRFPGSATHSELRRLRVDGTLRAEGRLVECPLLNLLAASRDGRAALLFDSQTNHNRVFAYLEGRTPALVPLREFRYAAGADMTADGRRAVISGTPTTCTETYLGRCPIELYGVDLSTDPPALHPIAVSARASYQPRFVPGTHDERVLYQTTDLDPSPGCAADLNHCWHDLVIRDWWGREASQPLRSGVVGPAYSPGGTRLAFLSYVEPAAGCTALPCSHQSLYVMTPGRDDARRIVAGEVAIFSQRYWSPDDRWLVYLAEDRTTHARSIKTVRADGAPGRALGDGRIIGWVLQ